MPEISEHINDYSFIYLGYAAHISFSLFFSFPDAPCVVGDLCFLQIPLVRDTYGAFDCAERLYLFPQYD
jgi:hypothetical protein